jgi:hypothetical protein
MLNTCNKNFFSHKIQELDPKCLIHVTKDTYEGEDAHIFMLEVTWIKWN